MIYSWEFIKRKENNKMPELKTIETLDTSPFKRMVMTIGTLPSAFVESMTYYEALCWFTNYLQTEVIPTVNNNGEAVLELQEKFIELKEFVDNYFDNLDVQEEINNKLDEMAEDDTLQEIISAYLNSRAVFGYININEMKEATNLIEGSYARTCGYYTINDGGGALYKIIEMNNTITVDNAHYVPLQNTELVAELIFDEINLNQWGAKGDGVQDDTDFIENAVNYAFENKINVTSSANKTYLLSESINIKNINIDLKNSTLKSNSSISELLLIDVIDNVNRTDYYGEVKNIIFDCNNVDSGLRIAMGRKKHVHDCKFINIGNIGLYYQNGYEVHVNDCHFRGTGVSNTIGLKAQGGDSWFSDLVIIDCHNAIYNNGANFYNTIHAWIATHALAQSAEFMVVTGNVATYVNQCYSDTYGITFSIKRGWVIADQVYVYFNPNIYEETFEKPYFFYFDGNSSTGYYEAKNTLTNSEIRGPVQHINFTNVETSAVKTNYNNLVRVDGYNSGVTNNTYLTPSAGIDNILINRQIIKNGFNNINLVFRLDTQTATSFTFTGIGTSRQPRGEVRTLGIWGDNDILAPSGIASVNISGGTLAGRIGGTVTGRYAYVRINVTYPIVNESSE